MSATRSPARAAEILAREADLVRDLDPATPARRYFARRRLWTIPVDVLWWPRQRQPHRSVVERMLARLPDIAVGVIVWRWRDPRDWNGPAIIELEALSDDGSRVLWPPGPTKGQRSHKRHGLPGPGIGGALFAGRLLQPFRRRAIICEGAIDAMAAIELGYAASDDDVLGVHSCHGLTHPVVIATLRTYREIRILPHMGDTDQIGERCAETLAHELGDAATIVRGLDSGDLGDELAGNARHRDVEASTSVEAYIAPLSETTPMHQPMIWRPWIPMGALSICVGAPGAGKTLLMVAICAAMTRGDPLPGELAGTRHEPATVGWLSLEESAGMVIAPRFAAAGADMDRVLHLQHVPADEEQIGSPTLTRILDHLLQRCRLIVFDSLEAWSGGAELSRPKEAREVVGWLHTHASAADATGVARAAIVAIHHDRKAAATDLITMASGSRQVTAPAESIFHVLRIPTPAAGGDPQRWVAHSKSRVAAEAEAWRVRVEPVPVAVLDPLTGRTIQQPHGVLRFDATPSGMSSQQLALMASAQQAGPTADDDHDDAAALCDAARDAHAAGTLPDQCRDGLVSATWMEMVAAEVDRPSGRTRTRGWWQRVLRAIEIRPVGKQRIDGRIQRVWDVNAIIRRLQ